MFLLLSLEWLNNIFLIDSVQAPNVLGFQLANTWTKITARDVYGMLRNGKEPGNLDFSFVAATVEKASTYVFAECLIRNAEVSSPTFETQCKLQRGLLSVCSYHWRKRAHIV
jgi:hypothetical protein